MVVGSIKSALTEIDDTIWIGGIVTAIDEESSFVQGERLSIDTLDSCQTYLTCRPRDSVVSTSITAVCRRQKGQAELGICKRKTRAVRRRTSSVPHENVNPAGPRRHHSDLFRGSVAQCRRLRAALAESEVTADVDKLTNPEGNVTTCFDDLVLQRKLNGAAVPRIDVHSSGCASVGREGCDEIHCSITSIAIRARVDLDEEVTRGCRHISDTNQFAAAGGLQRVETVGGRTVADRLLLHQSQTEGDVIQYQADSGLVDLVCVDSFVVV